MDNLGGIIKVEFQFREHIENCFCVNRRMYVYLNPGHEWLTIPARPMSAEISESTDKIVCNISGSIVLSNQLITDVDLLYFNAMKKAGIVLKLTCANGNVYIVGSNMFPVFGNVVTVPGRKAADLHHQLFSFSCKSLFPISLMG